MPINWGRLLDDEVDEVVNRAASRLSRRYVWLDREDALQEAKILVATKLSDTENEHLYNALMQDLKDQIKNEVRRRNSTLSIEELVYDEV